MSSGEEGFSSPAKACELDDEWFAKARPASGMHPRIVERDRRRRGRQTRLNDTLRQAVFGRGE